jgi:CHAT domain-containing protein/Tfp pilus assembly protein PilF
LQQEWDEAYGKARYADAERLGRQLLEVRRRWLGEGHLGTAESYNDLALVLRAQGKLVEAEALHRQALAIRLKVLRENHPHTATSYNNLALVLRDQGKLAEAEALGRRALAIQLKALGEGHLDTANSFNTLALVLWSQGKLAEAEALHRQALATLLKAVGEGHPNTAVSYNNLANVLRAVGKLPEAEAMHRQALAIRLKVLRENHPDTATSYNNLALVLRDQGKLAEAEALGRRALAISLKAVGEGHPDTAVSYINLALVLRAQEELLEAEALDRRALAISLKAVGEGHPYTALSYHHLGQTLDRLGRAEEALDALTAAGNASELARLRGTRGLEAAAQSHSDPAPALAIALARAGRAADAWGRWERGLARAVLDEVGGRAARPLTTAERASEADLLERSHALDERISRLTGRQRLTQDDEARLDDLRREAGELRRQLLDLQQALEQKYGPLAGRPVTLAEACAVLPEDAALVGWVDTEYRHTACVVRRSGEPIWVPIPGTGPDGAWTKVEESLAKRLRDALAARAPADDWRPMAQALAKQRLGPIESDLKGVRRVVVVNSAGLAGVPVEVLFPARGSTKGPGPVVAYAPSASMVAHLVTTKPPADRPATLLALGDPAYPAPTPGDDKGPTPPDHGLFVAKVVPNGNADLFGMRAGDVLLEYNGTALSTRDDLKVVAADGGPKQVPLRLWRSGEARTVAVAAGPLGVEFDKRPAAPVVLAQRAAAAVLAPTRAAPQTRLPGTRREVAAIADLFPKGRVTMLLGDQARESVVQDLARSGKLKGYRYLHFAAHGRDDPRSAYRTALVLAPDPDRPADPAAFEADGELTAEQIARTWDLDADLVVLSACETALGKQAGGEGFLGFAQPLLAKGARSLVLSLWKVDDKATALLMARFYQDVLGKRPGLSKPMPRAEALDEAKRWLRGLTEDEVGPALVALQRGEVRPLADGGAAPPREAATGPRPFDHPYYWAAFVLVGDPN